jgi:erythronate-4-phosphate dehydrogenase
MIRIIADENIPFLKGILEPYAEISYLPYRQITKDVIKNADALLIRTRTKCSDSFLEGTKVSFIGTATIGFDHINTSYCDSNNIKWVNAPGCNSSSVQQYITAALLNISLHQKFSLKGSTIGLVGVGNVGSKVEKAARLLGMNVLLNDPPRQRNEGSRNFVGIEKILDESDIVTVHVPLNFEGEDKTYHLFGGDNFRRMRKGAWFINSSRGEVVETKSLKDSLESGRLKGAVLDVWENEPDIDRELMADVFIATPHIAGYSTDGKANGTSMVVNSLCRFFDLPLTDWYPGNIEKPLIPEITIIAGNRSDEEIVGEAVFHTYNIMEDDTRLRSRPADFEKLRSGYPLRREFPAFNVKLSGRNVRVQKILGELGFRAGSGLSQVSG